MAISNIAQAIPYQSPERTATFLRGLQGEELKLAQTIVDQIQPAQRAKIDAALKKP